MPCDTKFQFQTKADREEQEKNKKIDGKLIFFAPIMSNNSLHSVIWKTKPQLIKSSSHSAISTQGSSNQFATKASARSSSLDHITSSSLPTTPIKMPVGRKSFSDSPVSSPVTEQQFEFGRSKRSISFTLGETSE